jgi:capsular exopolysaccharide synthesis family protein
MIGLLLGFVLSIAGIVLHEIFDITIRTEEDIMQSCVHPILSAVPDMSAPSKGGYYNSSSRNKKTRKNTLDFGKTSSNVGGRISFAATEAYKLLRTKLQFSFADERDCHVIGISSAMAGEGKSTSAINLAYSLAQLDNRVLLIECDLRRPTIAAKIPVAKMPGLTNFLARQVDVEDIIQVCELDEGTSFHVIASGRIPPNPIELLSSDKMEKTMNAFRANYDYIILDMPPVGEVSDALVAAKLADGMLLVVRQNYCNRLVMEDTIRQFEFVGARILGVVVSYASDNTGGYGKKYYYKRYSYRTEGRYSAPQKAAAGNEKQARTSDSADD